MARFENLTNETIEELKANAMQRVYGNEGQSVVNATQTFSQNEDDEYLEENEFVEENEIVEEDENCVDFYIHVTENGNTSDLKYVQNVLINPNVEENDVEEENVEKLANEIVKAITDKADERNLYKSIVIDEIMECVDEGRKEYLFIDEFMDCIFNEKVSVVTLEFTDLVEDTDESILKLKDYDVNEFYEHEQNGTLEEYIQS